MPTSNNQFFAFKMVLSAGLMQTASENPIQLLLLTRPDSDLKKKALTTFNKSLPVNKREGKVTTNFRKLDSQTGLFNAAREMLNTMPELSDNQHAQVATKAGQCTGDKFVKLYLTVKDITEFSSKFNEQHKPGQLDTLDVSNVESFKEDVLGQLTEGERIGIQQLYAQLNTNDSLKNLIDEVLPLANGRMLTDLGQGEFEIMFVLAVTKKAIAFHLQAKEQNKAFQECQDMTEQKLAETAKINTVAAKQRQGNLADLATAKPENFREVYGPFAPTASQRPIQRVVADCEADAIWNQHSNDQVVRLNAYSRDVDVMSLTTRKNSANPALSGNAPVPFDFDHKQQFQQQQFQSQHPQQQQTLDDMVYSSLLSHMEPVVRELAGDLLDSNTPADVLLEMTAEQWQLALDQCASKHSVEEASYLTSITLPGTLKAVINQRGVSHHQQHSGRSSTSSSSSSRPGSGRSNTSFNGYSNSMDMSE